jgi:hypothetical protein
VASAIRSLSYWAPGWIPGIQYGREHLSQPACVGGSSFGACSTLPLPVRCRRTGCPGSFPGCPVLFLLPT